MNARSDVLILPSDSPTSEVEVKKSLLFFDSVTLPNPADYALVNQGEVVEKFPHNYVITWSTRNRFPRTPEYLDAMLGLISDTVEMQNKGILRLTPSKPTQYIDSGVNWAVWHSVIANRDLVEAAVPDRIRRNQELEKASCQEWEKTIFKDWEKASYTRGVDNVVEGHKSKYAIATNSAAILEDANESWSILAHLRIGRFLKFVRLSHGLSIIPLAADDINQRMLGVTCNTKGAFPNIDSHLEGCVDLPNLALQLDIFDVDSLNRALRDMSWHEIQRLRKEVLPGMQLLRADLIKAAKLQGSANSNNMEEHKKRLEILLKDYQNKREVLAEEWEKLRVAAICKFGGVVGLADASGLMAITTGAPIIEWITKLFSAGLVGTAAISGELKSLIPAQRKVKKHPLYFIEKLPQKNEK